MNTTPTGLVAQLKRQGYLISALALVAAGLLLLLIEHDSIEWASEIGTTLLSTGLIAVVWQIFVDRWQTQSIRQIVESVSTATAPEMRLRQVRLKEPEFAEINDMLRNADELLMTCLYDSRWLDPWAATLEKFLSRGKSVRLICPDPGDHPLMAALAARHEIADPQRFQAHVLRLVEHMEHLESQHRGQIGVRFAPAPGPSYTSYLALGERGRGVGMTRQYGHQMHSGETLVEQTFDRGGDIFDFCLRDFENLWAASTSCVPRSQGRHDVYRVGVIGPGDAVDDVLHDATEVGRLIGLDPAAVMVTGGLGGVMEAAPAGMAQARPESVREGYLPGLSLGSANQWITKAVATGLGQARNFTLVDSCDAIVAVGFNEGTLIEASYAHQQRVPVFSLWFPDITLPGGIQLTTPMPSPRTAVDAALAAARRKHTQPVHG